MSELFDWEAAEPWAWEGDFDSAWDWPRFPTNPTHLDPTCVFYEPCPCCDLGTATFGNDLPFECPACSGSGIAGEHRC